MDSAWKVYEIDLTELAKLCGVWGQGVTLP
jgi:hypothetical protein